MERTRDYHRKMRAKAIKRKKYIAEKCKCIKEYYPFDGMYSKNKVHCSCGMCRIRDHRGRHLITLPEIFAIERMADELNAWVEDKYA